MGAVHLSIDGGDAREIPAVACGQVPASLMDRRLAEQAENAGRMLEAAYSVADRELALIWQRTMFDIVRLRRERRFGPGTENEGECLGG